MDERRRLGEPLFGYNPNAMNKERAIYRQQETNVKGQVGISVPDLKIRCKGAALVCNGVALVN
jgi:hypothetical protein